MTRPRAVHSITTIFSLSLVVAILCMALSSRGVDAQSQSQLVPLVTDNTPLTLSNNFGAPLNSVVNQAGDYAFIGNGGSAVYYRSAAASSATMVLQMGDEVPGFTGSRNDILNQIRLNNSGLLAFRPDFFQANGIAQGAIFTFDGATLQQVISGSDLAPGAGGAAFGRAMNLIGLNDAGEIAFSAPLIPPGSPATAQTTLYIKPAGGAPVRVAGLGDVAPGTGGGTFSTFNFLGFNNRGEELFTSTIIGGATTSGLFVGDITGAVRKVVALNDPNPSGGTFTVIGTSFLNNAGQVGFQSGSALYVDTPMSGIARVVVNGDAVPAPVGGSLGTAFQLQALSDGGDLVFLANLVGNGGITNNGLLRRRAGNPLEMVAYRNQPVGAPGEIFNSPLSTGSPFTGISVNATGTVSFRSTLTGGSAANGVFQQSGTNPPINIARDGDATTLSGGGTYTLAINSATATLNNDALFFRADVTGGTADNAELLVSGGSTTVLMNTGDALPPASRVSLRTFRMGGSGDSVGFLAQRTAGRFSIVAHSIQNQATNVLVTDGDVAPGTGGGLIRLISRNTVFQNTAGTTVFSAQLIGGSTPSNTGLFVRSPGGALTKIAANGDIDPVSGKALTAISINAVTPSPMNDSGQVVFLTTLLPVSGPATRALYRWSPGTGFTKIAAAGDTTSTGGTILNLSNPSLAINAIGHVAFIANIAPGPTGTPGIFVGSGGTPTKVVQVGDTSPAGGTFASLALPGFNDSDEVPFVAAITGGPGGGAFLGTTSAAPVTLALDGAAAPAGGNFSITTARPDIAINNQHDIVLRSNLTGGTADSGYFVRRGAGGTLQAIVLQGQPAPGTTGVFESIVPGLNNLVNENFQLGPDGDISFQNFFVTGGQRSFANWHVKTDNTIEEMLVRGAVSPEFGGGSAVVSTGSTAWNSGGRYPLWARISGGTFTDGIFLFVPVTETNTPPGTIVPVTLTDSTTGTTPVEMTFDNVTQPGQTTLVTSSAGPTVPTAFALGDPPVFYNIATTATFAGSINICIDFSSVSFPPGANLRLLHFENDAWVDVTTSGPSGGLICGSVTSLSPFTVVEGLDTSGPSLSVSVSPNVIWPPNKKMIAISANIAVSDDFDSTPSVTLVSITCNETLGAGDIQGATFNTDDRSFSLRADRNGNGSGRVYTITYRATDASGNSTIRTATVSVPHDQGH